MSRRPPLTSVVAAALVATLAACAGDDTPGDGPRVTRSQRGDTLVVRTESGSVWGAESTLVPEVSIGEIEGDLEYLFGSVRSLAVARDGTIYVVDGQVPDLRAFDADGRFLRTLGRPGEGPGEIKSPDGGLAILSDGRILIRDPGNARIQVYGPDGQALETWSIRGGFNTSSPLFKDRDDNVYTQILVDTQAEVRDWVVGLVRIHPDGTPGDTLIPPRADFEAPELEARREQGENHSVSRTGVPFAPEQVTTFHPDGWFVHGISDRYRLALRRPSDPMVIERAAEAAPVTAGEKSEEEARVTRNMRSTQPDWRWNGPPIPDRKPFFDQVYAGQDGRIWVAIPLAGQEVDDVGYDPRDPEALPDRWREPIAFDVFEMDGSYLGRVRTPLGFSLHPTPVFDGDRVWAVTRDELGVQRVVRFVVSRAS
jgi:hypothetical protein